MDIVTLKEKITKKKYKVISFDIFDTLLLRPCLNPTDILKLVGLRHSYNGNFLEMRRISEKKARLDKPAEKDEIIFDDIYEKMEELFSLSHDQIEQFKNTELDIEKHYLYARKPIKELFDFAVGIGKEVIIVSDIYLSKEFISEVLSKCGYKGYSKLYLSSEYGLMKSSGRLYDVVLNDYAQKGIKPSQILHMGDNEKSDVKIPKEKGINTVFIPRTNYLFRNNKKLKNLYENMERSQDNTFLIGYSLNRVYQDPFRKYDSNTYFYGSMFNFTYLLLAPFIYSFVKWMIEDCIQEHIDTLVMIYRDGYIPEKIYNTMTPYYKDIPKVRRLYLTRAMINKFFAQQKNGLFESIQYMRFSDRMTVGEFIKERLFAADQNEFNELEGIFQKHGFKSKYSLIGRRDNLTMFLNELVPYFEKNAAESIDNILKYCADVMNDTGKSAIYDVGYRGSVCSFLREKMGIESIGYHLFAKEEIRNKQYEGYNIKSPIVYGLSTEKESILLNCFTEDILNADEASVKDIKYENGEITLVRDSNYISSEKVVNMQNIIMEYAEGFSEMFGRDLSYLRFDITNYYEFYKEFFQNATRNDSKIFSRIQFIDSQFMNPNAENLYYKWVSKHNNESKEKSINKQIGLNIKSIENDIRYRLKPSIFLVGNPISLVIEKASNIKQFIDENNMFDFQILMESSEKNTAELKQLYGCDVKAIRRIDLRRGYDRKISVHIPDEYVELAEKNSYLFDLAEELYDKFKDMGKGYPEKLLFSWYNYLKKLISIYDRENAPVGFAFWDSKTVMHKLFIHICDEMNLPYVVFESGSDLDKDVILKLGEKLREKCSTKIDVNRRMKVGIVASMPRKGYSGGRTHALNLAVSLAYEGNEVYFISQYKPMFYEEMSGVKGFDTIQHVTFLKEEVFFENVKELDFLILVPHRTAKSSDNNYYYAARKLAIEKNAKLILLNFESPNWINKYMPGVPEEEFKNWKDCCEDGCLILCSDKESIKYASEYYVQYPDRTKFDYWYPTINSFVADKVREEKTNQIVAFIRPVDNNKGSFDILQMLDDKLKGYKIVLICGRGIKDDIYYDYIYKLEDIKKKYGLEIEVKMQITDYEKFVEISKSKFMLFPSYFEGYGTPPIEAQYFNTICFVYDLPVLRETCGDRVVYCNYGDPLDMKAKLNEAIKNNSVNVEYHSKVYDIANFERCAFRLDKMLRSHLQEDWRSKEARNKIEVYNPHLFFN